MRTGWADGAKLADGSYMHIDHNQVIVQIDAPQDEQLARLSNELNQTYLPYGKASDRREAALRQETQDTNAEELSLAVAATRALTKASTNYRNAHWDLVDALAENRVNLAELSDDELPESLRGLSTQQQQDHIQQLTQRRRDLQARIKTLSKERQVFVVQQRAQSAEPASDGLDTAIVEAVRKQATRNQFELPQDR